LLGLPCAREAFGHRELCFAEVASSVQLLTSSVPLHRLNSSGAMYPFAQGLPMAVCKLV
jgi:hypothetical protein